MKKFLKIISLIFLPFIILGVYIYSLPVNKAFGYGYTNNVDCNTSWIYYRIFENKSPIDVAFLGTSHTGCGINDSLITGNLMRKNHKIEAANLAYCTKGRNMQKLVFKDLVENKNPKIIFLEVLSKESVNGHKDFGYVASGNEVWQSMSIRNFNFFSDLKKMGEHRFQLFRQQVNGTLKFDPPENAHINYSYTPFHFTVEEEVLLKHSEKKKQTLQKGKKGIDAFKQISSFREVEEIVRIAEENNVQLYFLYLPSYGTGLKRPVNEEFYNQHGELIIPPKEIFENKDHWVDGEHLNYKGSLELGNWLSDFILKESPGHH